MDSTALRKTIAAFFDVDEAQVGPSFSLKARSDSVSRASLDAAIRKRVGQASKVVYTASTAGEIEAELFGSSAPNNTDAAPTAVPPGGAVPTAFAIASTVAGLVSCGVDIELVANLPQTKDFWEEPFYRLNFAPAEIAYCLRKDDPRMHLAARWAAKEALKKCEPSFLTREMNQIEIVVNEAGAPSLVLHSAGSSSPLPYAVSLSHTAQQAIAMVVVVRTPAHQVITSPPPPVAATALPTPLPKRGSKLGKLLNLVTFLLAAFALYRTYVLHP